MPRYIPMCFLLSLALSGCAGTLAKIDAVEKAARSTTDVSVDLVLRRVCNMPLSFMARAIDRHGSDFAYGHYMMCPETTRRIVREVNERRAETGVDPD